MNYIGIDIGSTYAKAAVLDAQKQLIFTDVRPTGWSSADIAASLKEDLLKAGLAVEDSRCTATGYGRSSVEFAGRKITEITCHAKGCAYIFSDGSFTLIDIGGQDTKIISVSDGAVSDFMMNDKCSAGTGRFLEVMANVLRMSVEEMCALARQGGGVTISSMCTVFAESEVISLIGKAEKKANIAYAIVESVASKVATQARRLLNEGGPVFLTGGLCEYAYIAESLSRLLNTQVKTDPLGRFAGAIGAAICTYEKNRNA